MPTLAVIKKRMEIINKYRHIFDCIFTKYHSSSLEKRLNNLEYLVENERFLEELKDFMFWWYSERDDVMREIKHSLHRIIIDFMCKNRDFKSEAKQWLKQLYNISSNNHKETIKVENKHFANSFSTIPNPEFLITWNIAKLVNKIVPQKI